jgi:hypothetical protein
MESDLLIIFINYWVDFILHFLAVFYLKNSDYFAIFTA